MPAIARLAENGVKCGKQHGGPGDRNDPARNGQSRCVRCCDVIKERACNDGTDDTQTEIHHDTANGAVEEPTSKAASGKSEQAEDNDWHDTLMKAAARPRRSRPAIQDANELNSDYRGAPRRTKLTIANRMTAPRNDTSKLGTLKLL